MQSIFRKSLHFIKTRLRNHEFQSSEAENFAMFGNTFGYRTLSFVAAEPFFRSLKTFTNKLFVSRTQVACMVHLSFGMLDLELPITPPDLYRPTSKEI